MKNLSTFLFLTLIINYAAIAQESNAGKANEFDFWVGEWDVNLRVKQPDLTWQDQHQSIARIYDILDGRAILELWAEQGREQGIIGYSLRYYDQELDQWTLWLNWPGPNRSGTISLAGQFRHGRGEFFGERPINDSTTMISRFTFSDITPTSLRWDDAFSTDAGKTWTNNWIMEFSRKADRPAQLKPGPDNHTNDSQARCTIEAFDHVKQLSRLGQLAKSGVIMDNYGVLEGCAVLSNITRLDQPVEFSVLTFNTYANIYEQLVFDVANAKAAIYYGPLVEGTIQLKTKTPGFKEVRWITIKDGAASVQAFDAAQPEAIITIF